MKQHSGHHQKIRFRRDEIADLRSFPSACEQPEPPVRVGRRRRRRRGLGAAVLLVSILAIGLALAVFSVRLFDVGSERMRLEAERAIKRVAGVDAIASLGHTGLSFDRSRLLAVEIADVGFVRAADRALMLKAGSVRFELRLLPLLTGRIELGSAVIADAEVGAAAFPKPAGDWTAALRNPDGLIDPDRVLAVVFAGTSRALGAFAAAAADTLELSNVRIDLPEAALGQTLTIAHASIAAPEPGRMALAVDAAVAGRKIALSGQAARDPVSHRVSDLKLDLTAAAVETVVADNAGTALPAPSGNQIGAVSIKVAGAEGLGGEPPSLKLAATVDKVGIDFGRHGVWTGDLQAATTLAGGSGKLEIDRLLVTSGRSRVDFNGAVGLAPAVADGTAAHDYRFELVSRDSVLAPADSPEPALAVATRIAGIYDPQATRLVADQIELSGGAGQAFGTLEVDFVSGKAPGVSLALSASDMPTAHLKQIWPWFSGAPARKWVLANVFGGEVIDSRVVMQVPPGRLGNGVPLNGEEVYGNFSVKDARFDVTGTMPPVRDAIGKVSFRGADIDIELASGEMYMPSGRIVAGRNGVLKIRNANKRPVIGDLDIDVEGEAPAVAELATYEPINALQKIGLAADDFAGAVKGHVKADIPLHKGIPREDLDWRVEISYRDLALAKPFDGQMLTDADGTMVVEKSSAVIDAEGRLNGVPAEILMTEPLAPGGPARDRKIAMVLDDKARRQIAPGLDGLLSGPVKVDVQALDGGKRDLTADLTGATLSLPWANWSKGPGIPAKVSFRMEPRDGGLTLSDLDLSGASFAARGTVRLAGGGLESADFSKVRLNRGDDASIKIKRSGRGYSVAIRGSSLDARALIKRYVGSGNGADAGKQAAAPGGNVPVTLSMDIASLGGFGSERLSGVDFSYSGNGSDSGDFKLSAETKSGASVTAANSVEGGVRRLTMKSADAGAVARFLDFYEHMQGGRMTVSLQGGGDGVLRGPVDARDFYIVNQPRLASLVATPPPGSDRSLNQVVRSDVDVSRAQFERGFAQIDKGPGYLRIANGVLRGPLIGSTFQGTLFDAKGNMDMTGTFMPAYGLNRIFGELPLIGDILGNGRDRGLIGVTYRLAGKAGSPTLQVNPLSVIAPGIFRSIFEY